MVDDEVLEKLVKLGYKQPIKEKRIEVEIVEWIRVLSFSYIHLLIKKREKIYICYPNGEWFIE